MTTAETIVIDASRFLGTTALRHIKEQLTITVTEHCFLPRPDDLQADWVASVAAPAFKIIVERRGAAACRSFCSIGTGVGMDALAAVEILGTTAVGVTDVHEDVVDAARDNITRNLNNAAAVKILAGTGDLLQPLQETAPRFDVIYENLPNVPLADETALAIQRTSSGFAPPRREAVPQSIKDSLLSLHYVALLQAKSFLAPEGTILSTLGARVPLTAFLDMAKAAGFCADFLTFGWKVQAQAQEIIQGHVDWQRHGLGPFHFYHIKDLERIFAGQDPITAARRALAIEQELLPHSIDAETALIACQNGAKIGHTVAVLQSHLR